MVAANGSPNAATVRADAIAGAKSSRWARASCALALERSPRTLRTTSAAPTSIQSAVVASSVAALPLATGPDADFPTLPASLKHQRRKIMKPKYEHTDITGEIGELFPSSDKPKYTMYSYSRPAYNFWQGFYDGLRKKGMTHEDAIAVLQSKAARHMLDGHADEVRTLGEKLAKGGFDNWKTYIA